MRGENEMPVESIRKAFQSGAYRLSLHAQKELLEDRFSVDDLEGAMAKASLVEDYPNARRGPCCLLSGVALDGRKMHVVATSGSEPLVVITVYEPTPPRWITPFKRGRRS